MEDNIYTIHKAGDITHITKSYSTAVRVARWSHGHDVELDTVISRWTLNDKGEYTKRD